MTPDGTVTKSEFARLRGVSPTMVTKWLKAGRLVLAPDGKRVNAAASLARIAQGSDPSRPAPGPTVAELTAAMAASAGSSPAPVERGGPSFAQVRTAREAYSVKQAELDYRERVGELVERAAYDKALADGLAPILAGLDSLSSRLGPELAAESDPRKVQNLIDAGVAELRRELADTLRRMIGGGLRQ